jgi:hypothetical protein
MFESVACCGVHIRSPRVHVPAFPDSYLSGVDSITEPSLAATGKVSMLLNPPGCMARGSVVEYRQRRGSMQTITIPQIVKRLQQLSDERLLVVYDFVSYLADREGGKTDIEGTSEAWQTMLASEAVLRRDWERPEEDRAWEDL